MPHTLALIALLPLVGFLFNGFFATALGRHRANERTAGIIGSAFPLAAFALTIKAFFDLQAGGYTPIVEPLYRWALIGTSSFEIAFYFDRLSAIMTLVVTGVGSVIHIYSTGYMHNDKSFGRFFAYLNLFLFFMLLLVLGRSMLVLFVGWEGVGLASYLLIGFWFDDLTNAKAGRKAFITNRIGDAGFLLGMFLLYRAFGTLDMDTINSAFVSGTGAALLVPASLVGLLLFVGATGKSAQIPLYVWLPDAMAGPTPVSALIHAATMVTAGVYLTARMSGIYMMAPEASQVIAVVGVLTAFFAATVALVQTDIKKVLAYSTVSQLGFMFLALGVGAYGVAIFHVVTHAFFKACLFLGAGSVIHALGGEQDIRKMGGLRSKIPLTFWTFAIATAAIAGIPGLAGFFSKDEILFETFLHGHQILWGVGVLTSLLTATYMFRLVHLTFHGEERFGAAAAHGHDAHDHAHQPHPSHLHDAPAPMAFALIVLAIGSVLAGYVGVPHALGGHNNLGAWLEPAFQATNCGQPVTTGELAGIALEDCLPGEQAGAEDHAALELSLMVVSSLVAFAGIGLATFLWLKRKDIPAQMATQFSGVHQLLLNKYYVDEVYDATIVQPIKVVSQEGLWRGFDVKIVDGAVNGAGYFVSGVSIVLRLLQNGSVKTYAAAIFAGAVTILASYFWR